MNEWPTERALPLPPAVFFSFYSTFCPFPLMNTGLILGLVKEEAATLMR